MSAVGHVDKSYIHKPATGVGCFEVADAASQCLRGGFEKMLAGCCLDFEASMAMPRYQSKPKHPLLHLQHATCQLLHTMFRVPQHVVAIPAGLPSLGRACQSFASGCFVACFGCFRCRCSCSCTASQAATIVDTKYV